MKNLNFIQKKTLELKNYADRIKSQNLFNPENKEKLNSNLISQNKSIHSPYMYSGDSINNKNSNNNNNLLGMFKEEPNWTSHPKVKAMNKQKKVKKALVAIKGSVNGKMSDSSNNNTTTVSKVKELFKSLLASRLAKKNSLSQKIRKTKKNSLSQKIRKTKKFLFYKGSRIERKSIQLISSKTQRYIKSLVSFNSELANMSNVVYNFNNSHKKFNVNSFLDNTFLNMGNIISRPVLEFTPNKIVINLFYYVLKSDKKIKLIKNNYKLKNLCSFLSNKFNKEVVIDLIRLHHPSLDSQILSHTIGILSEDRKVKFRTIMAKLFNNSKVVRFNKYTVVSNSRYCIPSALLGMSVRLGGRISSQKVLPRFTTINRQKGAFARSKSDLSTHSRFINKSRRGAFSYTVTLTHKSF